jgi:hypothetical protein
MVWTLTFLFSFIIGGALSYLIFHFRVKVKRKDFMLGIEKDVNRAVLEYENNFVTGKSGFYTPERWKSKFGYINNFVRFPYKRLGLKSEYKSSLKRYFKYYNA